MVCRHHACGRCASLALRSAAGGALDGADMLGLNMARRVTDGEQIVVGIGAPPGQPTEMGSSVVTGADSSAGTADAAMDEKSALDCLPWR